MIDLAVLRDWLSLVALVISVSSAVWIALTKGSKENGAKIDALTKTITERLDAIEAKTVVQDERIKIIETEFRHLPTAEQVGNLNLSLVELQGDMKSMNTAITGLTRTVGNIDTYLRSREGK